MQKKSRIFAFDFDGVIAQYEGFIDKDHTGEPIPEVVNAIKKLKENGHRIIIHSTKGDQLLKDYCAKYDIPFDYINENPDYDTDNPGKPVAYVYVDDRAVRYERQSADRLVSELENFKPYWQR